MISVIIATKNGEKYISRAIQSTLAQSVARENAQNPVEHTGKYAGFEIIVVSDGSTDKTAEIVRKMSETDSRIKLIELDKNIGPGLARNLAILGEANKFVAILDDDDLWQNPDKLKNQLNYLEENPDVVLVGAKKTEFTRENGAHLRWITNETDSHIVREHMLSYNPVITSSVVFRTSIFAEVGGFKSMYLAEDYDLWLRMGLHGNISNVEGAETTYTMRDESASKAKSIEMAKVVLQLVKEYRHQYPHFLAAYIKAYARILLAYWKLIKKGKNPFRQ